MENSIRNYTFSSEANKKNYINNVSRKMHIMTIPITQIRFADYQRETNKNQVENIVANYDPDRDRPVELSYRDNYYWCFDGAHRIKAHQRLGIDTIIAQVHYGLTYEDEADLFHKQNINVRTISVRDDWKAAIASGDRSPETQNMIRLASEQGFEIFAGHTEKKNTFCCIRELRKTYDKHGENGFKTMIWLIRTAWDGLPNNCHHDIVAGINKIMETFMLDDKHWNRLRDRLAKMTPNEVLRMANTGNGRGGKRVAICLIQILNKGVPNNSKSRFNEYKIH